MTKSLKLFNITFLDEHDNEETQEIPAYTYEQALFILSLDENKVIYNECAVNKYLIAQ
jgi:hypothetical protein